MTTTTDPLFAAILRNLDDDSARLAYADYLQENGEGQRETCPECKDSGIKGKIHRGYPGGWDRCGACNGSGDLPDVSNLDRAELIRWQHELAGLPPKPRELFVADGEGKRLEGLGVAIVREGGGYYSASCQERGLSIGSFLPNERVDIYAEIAGKKGTGWMRGMKYVRHIEERQQIIFRKDEMSVPWTGTDKRKRESAILAAHPEWVPKCAACDGNKSSQAFESQPNSFQCQACNGTGRARTEWRCGFPDRVYVPSIGSVLEHPKCMACKGSGAAAIDSFGSHGICAMCSGQRVNAAQYIAAPYATGLRTEFPTLRSVVPVDRVPNSIASNRPCWYVHSTSHLEYTHWLPPILLKPLQKISGCLGSNHGVSGHVFEYATTELAIDILGRALREVLWS